MAQAGEQIAMTSVHEGGQQTLPPWEANVLAALLDPLTGSAESSGANPASQLAAQSAPLHGQHAAQEGQHHHGHHRHSPSKQHAAAAASAPAHGGFRRTSSSSPKPTRSASGRLTWSQALHERFLMAVQHLGGPDKATPAMILKIMNVEGLSVFHVKSHLQRYRANSKCGYFDCGAAAPQPSGSVGGSMPQGSGSVGLPPRSNTSVGMRRQHSGSASMLLGSEGVGGGQEQQQQQQQLHWQHQQQQQYPLSSSSIAASLSGDGSGSADGDEMVSGGRGGGGGGHSMSITAAAVAAAVAAGEPAVANRSSGSGSFAATTAAGLPMPLPSLHLHASASLPAPQGQPTPAYSPHAAAFSAELLPPRAVGTAAYAAAPTAPAQSVPAAGLQLHVASSSECSTASRLQAALRHQMELQQVLLSQLAVQRQLQLNLEAHGRYIESLKQRQEAKAQGSNGVGAEACQRGGSSAEP